MNTPLLPENEAVALKPRHLGALAMGEGTGLNSLQHWLVTNV